MALRVTSRVLAEASTPAYQASTMVRSRPKAQIATTRPISVSACAACGGRRSSAAGAAAEHRAWLIIGVDSVPESRTGNQHAFFEMHQAPGAPRPWGRA
jgi:hypothetical protein